MHFGNIIINARFKDFSDLVDRHLSRVPGTKKLEAGAVMQELLAAY